MQDLSEILDGVKAKIAAACARAGRDPAAVEIVAVTKTHGAEVVREAWDAGLAIIGENKVQEAAWKKPASVSGPMWHLIGHLQSNKVRPALELFDFIHSVDSAKLADRINAVADAIGAMPRCLLEVNVSGEKSKSGMRPEEVAPTLRHVMEACPRVTVEGLMTMAPFSPNSEDARPHFRRLRELRDRLEQELGIQIVKVRVAYLQECARNFGAQELQFAVLTVGAEYVGDIYVSTADRSFEQGGYGLYQSAPSHGGR